ncbi:MAG: glycosyltransferase family 2 protein [Methyloligellaceae bacterium]
MTSQGYYPLFSVCIPGYNSAKHIEAAIESVLTQTCGDFELLIQDDVSTDRTADIIKSFDDPRLYYKKNESNLGIFGNLNVLCKRARGEYIKILCADDMLSRNCLQTIEAVLNDHEQKPKVISVKETGSPKCLYKRHRLSDLHMFSINKSNLFKFLCEKHNWGGGLAELCVERDFFRMRNYFGENRKGADFSRDIIVWFEMALETDVLMINEPLVYQRQHSGQARYKLPRINQLREMFEFFYGRERDLQDLAGYAEGRKRYLDRYLMSHYWYGMKYFASGGGMTYLNKVSSLRRQYKHSDIAWNVLFLRILERLAPVRI